MSTVGLNEATIAVHQGAGSHDIALDKLSVKEYEDPFKRGDPAGSTGATGQDALGLESPGPRLDQPGPVGYTLKTTLFKGGSDICNRVKISSHTSPN